MKQKKVAALLLTMALCAGMAVPQSVVAFAAETGISEATLESDEVSYTDTFYDSGKVKEAYCTNTEEIKKALKNASTLASEVSKIYITNNIDLELGEAEYLEVPLNTYVMISSYPEGKKYYLKSTKASTNASTTNGIIIGKGKELSFSNIVIDGNHQRRCIYLNSQQGVLNIGEGTIIQNGGNTTNNNIKGLGIYTNGMRANVNIANNTEITGCNLYSDKTTAGTYGKAVCVEAAAGSLNILGGKIYSNDDFFVEAEYSRSRVLTGANGTVLFIYLEQVQLERKQRLVITFLIHQVRIRQLQPIPV